MNVKQFLVSKGIIENDWDEWIISVGLGGDKEIDLIALIEEYNNLPKSKEENAGFKKVVGKKLRVYHFAQVPCKPFCIDVIDEYDAVRIIDILAKQHLFLFEHNIIPDYSNVISVEMYDDDVDGEGNPGWMDYQTEDGDEWDVVEEMILEEMKEKNLIN